MVSSGIPVYFLVALKRIWEQKLSSGFMRSLRLPEQHRFSTRPIVSPIIYVCYLQHWVRFYVVRTETSLALPCRVHRHLLISAIMVCLMGHTAVQSSVAEGFLAMEATIRMARCRWFEDGLGSRVVFWIDVPHVHCQLSCSPAGTQTFRKISRR